MRLVSKTLKRSTQVLNAPTGHHQLCLNCKFAKLDLDHRTSRILSAFPDKKCL